MPAAHVDVGWTYSTTIQLVQTIVGVVFGGGTLWGVLRGVALLWGKRNESRALDIGDAAGIRKEMMELNDRQTTRIAKLEDDIRDERKRCDEEVSELRKSHAREVAEMRLSHADQVRELTARIDGLHNQMIQMQRSTGSVIELAATAPTAATKMLTDAAGIGKNLKKAYEGDEGEK